MGTRISDFTELTSAADDDELLIVDTSAGSTKKITKANLIGSSGVLQMVAESTSSAGTTTARIPIDGTIPQNTEGTELLTATITPTSASSTLVIEVDVSGYPAVPSTVALFQDSNADALTAVLVNRFAVPTLVYKMTAGTTSATTFKVRIGPRDSGETFYYNRSNSSSSPYGSGMMTSSIVIWEF